jgi:hypothetical protein
MRKYNGQEMCQRVFQDGIASQSFYLQDVRVFSHCHTNSHADPWSHNFYDRFLSFVVGQGSMGLYLVRVSRGIILMSNSKQLQAMIRGRLPLGETLGVQFAVPCKEVRVFETSPALVAIIVAILLLLDYRFHGVLLCQPFGLIYG